MGLDEVQAEGDELFYNDGTIQVSVNFVPMMIDENDEVIQGGHDDTTLWEDEELSEELRELVIEEYEN